MVIAKVAGTHSLEGAEELGLGEQEVRWRRRFVPRPVPHRLGKIADLTGSSGSRNKGYSTCAPNGKADGSRAWLCALAFGGVSSWSL